MALGSKRAQAELSMTMVAFIWGTTFVVVKNALADIGPFLFLGFRFLLAFVALAVLSFDSIKKIRNSTATAGSLLGIFLFVGYANQTVGLKYTTSGNAGFITGVSVVLVPIMYAVLKKRWPPTTTLVTVAIATVGLFFLSIKPGTFHLAYGDLLVLIGAFGFALHVIFVDRYSYRHNPVAITSVQLLVVGVLCFTIGFLAEPWPQRFTSTAVLSILVTSLFATSLAFLTQNATQKYSTPTRFAVVLTTEPVFAALAGYLWAGETLSRQALIGAALILFSMLISILTRTVKNIVEANV